MWLILLIALVAVIGVALYNNLGQNREGGEAKLGPDGTNVDPPETFVVHHEGKGQGLDVANTALKERTETIQSDLPGTGKLIQGIPIPGRDAVTMDVPTDDVAFTNEKIAPGQAGSGGGRVAAGDVHEPGESKEKILREGPVGSRLGTPEEPGSPYQKGRRVTDIRRSHEAAAELLPDLTPGAGRGRARNTRGPDEVGLGDTVEGDWGLIGNEADLPPLEADGIIALVKDPHSLYVFWGGLHPEPEVSGEWRGARMVLRVYDVANEAQAVQEHYLDEGVDHWWVEELADGHTYFAEIGLISPLGYSRVGVSDNVTTPHATAESAHPLFGTLGGPGEAPTSP